MSGFGAGLILPAFLAPVVGVANVVPVMAVAMLFNNGGRIIAFWHDIQWPHVKRILLPGLPACIGGAYAYTLLSAGWIAAMLGTFILLSVPIRRLLNKINRRLSPNVEYVAGTGFGFINGGISGAGILLISILMSAGLSGSAMIATDAIISLTMGVAKTISFSSLSALNPQLFVIGLLIGFCAAPGAFIARWLLKRIPAGIHAWMMEIIVAIGALSLLRHAL